MTKIEKRTNHRLSAERLNVVTNAEKHSSLLNKAHRNSAHKMTRTVQLQALRVHYPINAQIGLLIANHVQEFCYRFDYILNREIMLCILRYITLRYAMLCYVMFCYVICYVMLCYVMLCYVMLCYVMLCYVQQIDVSFYFYGSAEVMSGITEAMSSNPVQA